MVRAATPDPKAQKQKRSNKSFSKIEQMVGEFTLENVQNVQILTRARQGNGPQIVPQLTPQFDQMTQFAAKSPQAEQMARIELLDLTARLAFWDQPEAIASIQQMVASDVPATAIRGRIAQNFLDWRLADYVEGGQETALNSMKALAAEVPLNDDVAQAILYLLEKRPVSVEIGHSLNVAVDGMKTPASIAYSKLVTRIYEPLTVKGMSLSGSDFSTAKWKGKVVVVDCWATWCPGCRAFVPEVVSTYQKYHDKGLEILGVSSDSVKQDLTTFLSENPDMVWPQLFTANSDGSWNPVTKKLHVFAIPTVFLIDRKGILREQECARPLNDDLIVKVLAETDAAPKPVPAPPAPVLAAPAPTTPAAKTPEPPVVPTKDEGGGL